MGSHRVKAVLGGATTDAGSVSSSPSLAVGGQAPSVTTPAVSGVADSYRLTATVTGGGSVAPTGTMTFTDANNGNATLALDGQTAVEGFQGSSYAVRINPWSAAVGT